MSFYATAVLKSLLVAADKGIIDLIKQVRTETGMSLKEAKDFVDALRASRAMERVVSAHASPVSGDNATYLVTHYEDDGYDNGHNICAFSVNDYGYTDGNGIVGGGAGPAKERAFTYAKSVAARENAQNVRVSRIVAEMEVKREVSIKEV